VEEVSIENTVFGDPCYVVRFKRLLDAPDEPTQLQILIEEFTLLELINIAKRLMSKAGQHTADERRLIYILAQHGGELKIVVLLRAASRMGEKHA